MEANNMTIESNQALSENRIKWFMEMLAVKKDTGMTRIYSAIKKQDSDTTSNSDDKGIYDDMDF